MKTKIRLKHTLQPKEDLNRLFNKFNGYWSGYINKEVKRKFFYVVSPNEGKIKDFRASWKIPEDGFKTEEACRRWLEDQIKAETKISKGKIYWETIVPYESYGLILEEKRKVSKTITPRSRFGKKSAFTTLFQRSVEELARDIGLDNSWYLQFEEYIFFNIQEMESVKDVGIRVSKRLKDYGGEESVKGSVVLEFGPNTRLRDIQFIWKDQVEIIQKQLPGFINIPPHAKLKRSAPKP